MMAKGVGEYLVDAANRRGVALWVDVNTQVVYYPANKMPKGFLRLLNSKYEHVRQFLLLSAVTQE